jgi:hypothetical protein
MPQLEFLDDADVAPAGRSRRRDPATSKRAARAVGIKVGALKHRILRHLAERGALGANDWELHVHCDPKGRVHSAATRRGELQAAGHVRETALERPTDTPSMTGVVHVITDDGATALADLDAQEQNQ